MSPRKLPWTARERLLLVGGIVMFAGIVAMIVVSVLIFSPGLSILVFIPACAGFAAIMWLRGMRRERRSEQGYVPDDYPG